jgi:hypothetical protein
MSRLLTAVEKAAYEQEVERARLEGRDPQWASLNDFLEENIPEEDLVWGSDSMREYGAKGRHESHGTSAAHDRENDVNASHTGDTTYPETLPDDSEHHEIQREADARAKAEGTKDADVYDPNLRLGAAIAAGINAGAAEKSEGQSEFDAQLQALSGGDGEGVETDPEKLAQQEAEANKREDEGKSDQSTPHNKEDQATTSDSKSKGNPKK